MSKYSKYSSYKVTKTEWLGLIPSSWSVAKHKYHARFVKGRNPAELKEEYQPNFHRYLSMEYLRGKANAKYAQLDNGAILVNDDQVLIIWDGSNAGEFVRGKEGLLSSTMAISIMYSQQIYQKYYWYLCVCLEPEVRRHARGMGIPHVDGEELKNTTLVIPSIDEQTQIASFLEHETAKIDRLIEKQQRLIELLKEKRQEVISHAVTKGLNPDAPMKESGVEWLGEVPENWVISKFGYLSLVVRGGSPRPAGDPTLFNGDYSPWVTVAEITKDNEVYLDSTETYLTKLGSEQCRVFKSGTLLLSNSGATLGVPKILRINANANDGVVGFECLSPKLDIEFAYYYLASLTSNLRERINQGSGQPNLNTDLVKDIFLPLPSLEEQQAIVGYVKLTLTKLDSIKSSSEKMMSLLQERRKALISAAVTGKIDVRDQVPQDVEEAVAS